MIDEIAARLELTELEVRNVISYYSMLTTKPRGKFNVQVCTNIAACCAAAKRLSEHCEKKLGVGHKETTPDGLFYAGRSGVHRGLQLGSGGAGELRLSREPDAGEDGQGSGRVQKKAAQ